MSGNSNGSSSGHTKAILIGILVGLLVILVIQNTDVVRLRFFFWTLSMSQIVLIPLALLAGFVVGVLTQAYLSKRSYSRKTHIEMPML